MTSKLHSVQYIEKFKGHHSLIYLLPHEKDQKRILALCHRNPLDVLGAVFPHYHVESIGGYALGTTDATKLVIESHHPESIGCDLTHVLESSYLNAARREGHVSPEDVGSLIRSLQAPPRFLSTTSRTWLQRQYDLAQISEVLLQYAGGLIPSN